MCVINAFKTLIDGPALLTNSTSVMYSKQYMYIMYQTGEGKQHVSGLNLS